MKKSIYEIVETEIMAKGWSQLLRLKVSAALQGRAPIILNREVADHGHGASILPIDKTRGTVLLVKQWRAGAAYTGHHGWLLEACAGLLDADDPIGCATREALEELGVEVRNVQHVCECFASPGAFSERLSLFTAEYGPENRIAAGGGLAEEHEDIEVIEMPLNEAFAMIGTGGIVDAKTIILLQHAMITKI
jgi:nudix-type nucleoside diphosphatase (YffH/AdpP family)